MRLAAWGACVALAMAGTLVSSVRGQSSIPTDNAELARMYQEDQDDRKPGLHGIDWTVVKPRDIRSAGGPRQGGASWHYWSERSLRSRWD